MASLIIDDLRGLDAWLKGAIVLLPFALPVDRETPEELPLVYKDVLQTAEEFRTLARPILGAG